MGRISSTTGKILLGTCLVVSIAPSFALDSSFQKPDGSLLDMNDLIIDTNKAIVGGAQGGAAVVVGDPYASRNNVTLNMSNTEVKLNDNRFDRAVRSASNTVGAKISTNISGSTIEINANGGAGNGNTVAVLSEGRGTQQEHYLSLNNNTISATATANGFSAGVLAWSDKTSEVIDIKLLGINNISAEHTNTNQYQYAVGIDTGVGTGNKKTTIVEIASGGTITALAAGQAKSYGIWSRAPNGGVNSTITIDTRSTISSTSMDGDAYGIYVSRLAGNAGQSNNTVQHNGNITVDAGSLAYGINVSGANFKNNIIHNGKLNVNSTSILPFHGAYGIYSTGSDIAIASSGSINVNGNNGYGIYSSSTGNSSITSNSDITVSGALDGKAIYSATTTGENKVDITGGNVQGSTVGIHVVSTSGDQTINNSGTISSTNDQAILSTNTSGTTIIDNDGVIKGYSTITGNNVTFNNQGTLELQNFATSAKGAINYTIGTSGSGTFDNSGTIKFSGANFDGTNTHATFNVANFTNSGRIDLTGKNPTGATISVGDTFTINGNYISNGGSLYLNTLLDDGSGLGISDLLKVNGDVTTGNGATSVYITPTSNSLGQLTTGKGIKIIEVSGTSSADAFVLGKPLTSGAYEYVLGQDSSATNIADPNWYLTSFYNNNSNHILYNPAVASYLTNQTAAVEMFQQSLFDRLTSSSNGVEQGAHERLLWLRTTMKHGSRRSVQANMSNRGRSYTVQFGSDLALWEVNDGYLHVGVMGGYGDAEDTSTSRTTRTKTDGKVKGYSAGLYGTWFQQQETYLGLYVDLWSQMGWYRNEVSGASQVATKKYNSTVWSSSVEAGYGISLGKTAKRNWVITPQLQLVYNLYDADNQHDKNNLYVSDNNATGIVARTGIKLSGNSIDKRVLEPFMEVNWLHTTAKNELKFNGQTLKDGLPRNRVEANIGLRGNISDRWSVAAQVGGQWGQNHFNQYEGQFNINYRW